MSIQADAKRFDKNNLDSKSASNIVSIANDDENYKKGYPNAGIALIFTQQKFLNDHQTFREGADVDERNMKSILRMYGYDVRAYRDYTTEKIENELKNVARMDHTNNSSLIVVMMSHGGKDDTNDGIISTYDGNMKVDLLWKYFTGDRCPKLVEKPKLFFIQACRGTLCDFRAVVEEDEKRYNQERSRSSTSAPAIQRLPIMADILVMFSTADTYVSYRDPKNGSWFIEALYKQLENYLSADREKDLMSILTSVNRYVAFSKEFTGDHFSFKQMPVIMSMLTKAFYFDRSYMTSGRGN
ncbi:caspase-3-like [Chironomus tepperi]|uniref:caspase-3-like n=1 Tax=Chironomus tepperi TaxID=113505 RepID=UPI00391F56C8